jgi:hypothetical protein
VRPPSTIGPLSSFGLFALLFGLLAGALWWLGPDLARDWRIDGEVVHAEGARIEEARCRSRLFLLTACDITVLDERRADPSRRTLWYFFIDRAESESIVLVRPKSAPRSDPQAITTNLGLDKLYHRLLALTLIVALLMICIALSIQLLWQGASTRRQLVALSGQRLHPVVVGLEGSIPIAHKRRRWTYVYDRDGRQERAFIELAKGNDPLFVTPDGKRALALCGPGGGVPLLLDAKLTSLDLSEEEKDAFFAACRQALGEERVA